ncbi:MAG TPA: helix-turn-helix transcriptional regulator, partial [Pseudonocardiaceae bacterium]
MEHGQKSTIRSRELGEQLRHAMELAHLSGKLAALRLGWTETKVSRLLTGRQAVKEADVASLLTLCGVKGDEKDRLLDLAREYNQRNWLQHHISRLPEQLRTLINHENQATQIHQFDAARIPGLLQTEYYARALIQRDVNVPPTEVEARVQARMSRQTLFSSDRHPDFTYFLHESALRLPVGGRVVMSDQLHQLLRLGVRRYISIRVIPLSHGAHPAMDNSCRLVEFEEMKPVVYVEEQTAGNFMEDASTVAVYRRIFGALADCSLSEGESMDA